MNKPVPPGIALEMLRQGIPATRQEPLLLAMAERGDWWAQHWKSCGLLYGMMASKMCQQGHRAEPGITELTPKQVRDLAEELNLIEGEPS